MAKKLKSLNPIIGTGYKTLSMIKDGEDGNIENFPDTLPKIPRLSYKRLGVSGLEIGWEFEDKIYYTYELYGSTTKGFEASEENLIFQGLASSYFYEAKPGEKWYFKARVKNTHGRYTEFSSELVTYTVKLDNLGEYVEGGSINGALIENATINNAHIKDLHADKITAGVLDADRIGANSINSNHIQANTIQSEHIQTGAITAGSGIIADGAIGSAQISSLDAAKIEAGTIDTSKVTIQGANGHLRLKGNRMQVFQGTGNQAKERVSVGDVNGDGSVYGLRVRGADGQTILLDENGVKSEGITDGAITNDKISDDANIDGAKLNINSVVSKINEDGTETIQGTKIEVDGTTLNTKLSTITNKQTEDSERITQAQSQITANTNAIKLKVDEQTYTTDKTDMTSKLEKNTSEISAMKGQIALKVEQADIENAISEVEGVIDTKIDSAKAEIKVTTDAITQNVSNLSQTVSNKADGSTVSTLNNKVGSLETSVNGITGKVSNLEQTTNTINGKVSSIDTRLTSAESKITETAITNTVKKNFYTKNDIDSKGYQTESQVQQTVNGLEVKVKQSGGYNNLFNSGFKKGTSYWSEQLYGTATNKSISTWDDSNQFILPNTKALVIRATNPTDRYGVHQNVKVKEGATYSISALSAGHRNTKQLITIRKASDGAHIANIEANPIGAGKNINNWRKMEGIFTIPSGCTEITVCLYMVGTGNNSDAYVWYTNVLLSEGKLVNEWSPHPSEVYDGITTIDKDGITVTASNVKSKTNMSANGFKITKTDTNEDVFKVNSDGTLYLKGQIIVTGGSVPTSNLSGTISSNQLNSSITSDINNAKNNASSALSTANTANSTANSNKTNITNLQGEVNTVKNNVASLEVTTSGISQKVSSVESTTATLNGKVNTANNNATNALNKANSANTLADSKAKVFTSTPTVPYKVGDLWVQGTNGDVMKCKTARSSGSYTASDWEKASKYTDDTKANAVDGKVTNLQTEYNKTKSQVAEIVTDLDGITQRVSSTESTTVTLTNKVNTAQSTADAAKSAASTAQSTANTAKDNASKAQTAANNAQSTADSKAKVFTSTPTVPYKVGDLWTGGPSGDVMRCKTARTSGSYTASDWEKASKYTDDTKANAVDGKVTTLQGTVNTTNSKVATLETNLNGITQRVSSTESTTATLTTKVNTAQSTADAAKTAASNAQNSANNANNALSINQQTKMNGIELFNNEYKSNTSARPFTNGNYSVVVATEISGANANESNIIKVTNGQILYTDFIACNINNPYYASIEVYNKDTNNGTNYIQVCYYDKNKTALESNEAALNAISGVTIPSANAWHKLEGWVNVPASNDVRRKAKYVRIRIINRYSGLSGITYWRNISWKQLGSGLLVDTQETKTEIASTKSKVATIETNLNGITQRVQSTESTVSTHTTQLGTVDNRINTAKNSAISTAANDATTKANNAQTNAKNYTDGQITTVNKTITDKVAEIKTTTDAITSRVSKTEQVASSSLQGKMLYTDPTFKSGNNSINLYNNASGGAVTVSRVAKSSDCPTTSGYMLQIKTTGTASPGHGGFYFGTGTRANAILITKIIAKIPSGCTLNWASNGYGTGGKQEWLTSTAGTGNWQEYICKVTCGTSGTFSSTNFFYLSGGTTPVTWYVAMATVFDITDTSNVESRLSTAEQKITDDAITNTVKKNFYTKSETDSQITSKGYQTASQVQQTVNGLQVKVSQSGGYNLIKNSTGESKNTRGWTCTSGTTLGVGHNDGIGSSNRYFMYLDNGTATSERYAFSSRFKLKPNTKYTFVGYFHNYTTCPSFDVFVLSSTSLADTDTSTTYTNVHHLINGQNTNGSWKKFTATFTTPASTRSGYIRIDNNGYNSAGTNSNRIHWNTLLLVEGELELPWSPHPSEVYDGVTTIDKDGITVTNTSSSTYTQIDSESFRVENNTGGTVAEFSQNSQIPNLTAGIINANEIYANNICEKSPMSGSIKYIVNGTTGNDNGDGSYSYPFKTVSKAVSMIKTQQDQGVIIEVYGSVPGWDVKGINGTGRIDFYFASDAIINGAVIVGGVNNTIGFYGGSDDKATFKNGISIYRCRDIEISSLTFRGTNSNGTNIHLEDVTFARVSSCDLGGLNTQLLCAIQIKRSNLWLFNCRGSKITDVVAQYENSIAYAPRAGTSNVPDYSNVLFCNYDGNARIHNWAGGNFVKTPSKGWNPAYTPTQKTQTWNFNKVWSDETLNGWSDRQELIQGYASTWNTGRWTGYMQFTDGMAAIRNAISGGTNFSGRLYVQRRTSSGNSTGSKLCLYASDGTLITNSTTINRGQGVWVTLSSAIISKIASGAITYFYLKADANNTSTFFKCEANPKIEITYTK